MLGLIILATIVLIFLCAGAAVLMMHDVKGTPNADDEKDTPAWVAASSASELIDAHDLEIECGDGNGMLYDCGGATAEEDTPAFNGAADDTGTLAFCGPGDDEIGGDDDDVEGTPNADDEKDTPVRVQVEVTWSNTKPKKKQETAAASSAKRTIAECRRAQREQLELDLDGEEGDDDDEEDTPNADFIEGAAWA